MYLKKILILGMAMGLVVTPLRSDNDDIVAAGKLTTHLLCFAATAYWVSDHISQSDPFEGFLKTAATLSMYMLYAPSIALYQSAITLRKLLKECGIRIPTPELRKALPVALTACAGWHVMNLGQYAPKLAWIENNLNDVHTHLELSPTVGSSSHLVALMMALGIWYNITDDGSSK